jgi:hypothetical protein
MEVVDLKFVHLDPDGTVCTGVGFELSADGMELSVGSGMIFGNEVSASSFMVQAPASGESCFGIFVDCQGDLYPVQDSTQMPEVPEGRQVKQKIIWLYVNQLDTDIESKTACRYLPL